MTTAGVRKQPGVVNIQALQGYDHPAKLERIVRKQKLVPVRFCSHHDCAVKLSVYNTGTYCSQHERGTIPTVKLI